MLVHAGTGAQQVLPYDLLVGADGACSRCGCMRCAAMWSGGGPGPRAAVGAHGVRAAPAAQHSEPPRDDRPACPPATRRRVRRTLATQVPQFSEGQQERLELKHLQLPSLQHLHPAWQRLSLTMHDPHTGATLLAAPAEGGASTGTLLLPAGAFNALGSQQDYERLLHAAFPAFRRVRAWCCRAGWAGPLVLPACQCASAGSPAVYPPRVGNPHLSSACPDADVLLMLPQMLLLMLMLLLLMLMLMLMLLHLLLLLLQDQYELMAAQLLPARVHSSSAPLGCSGLAGPSTVLLGAAAGHSSWEQLGPGAGAALEDCAELGRALERAQVGLEGPGAAGCRSRLRLPVVPCRGEGARAGWLLRPVHWPCNCCCATRSTRRVQPPLAGRAAAGSGAVRRQQGAGGGGGGAAGCAAAGRRCRGQQLAAVAVRGAAALPEHQAEAVLRCAAGAAAPAAPGSAAAAGELRGRVRRAAACAAGSHAAAG